MSNNSKRYVSKANQNKTKVTNTVEFQTNNTKTKIRKKLEAEIQEEK